MEKDIKFSIIMPAYNRAFCIKNAIDAVLKQTYQDFELIIADDCSTDNTEQLIKESYPEELESAKIIYLKTSRNGGPAKARNLALKHAENNWITYVDSDNIPKSDFLQTFAENINEKNLFYYAKAIRMHSQTEIGQPFDRYFLMLSNFIDMGILCHHKSLYNKYGGFDEKIERIEDWDFAIRYTNKTQPVFIDKIILEYNDSDDIERISNSMNYEKGYFMMSLKNNLYIKRLFNPYSNEYYRRFRNFLKNKCGIQIR